MPFDMMNDQKPFQEHSQNPCVVVDACEKMDFRRPASTTPYQGMTTANSGGGVGGGSDGTFWNEILDKDAPGGRGMMPEGIPSTPLELRLEPIRRKMTELVQYVWKRLRPDVEGSNNNSHSNQELRKFRLFLLSLGGVATFFWCWAIYNTTHKKEGQDLGMYSFGLVMITSLVGLITAIPKGAFTKKICILITTSHVLVAINYALGVLFAFTIGTVIYWRFGTYCIAFCLLWGYAAHYGWKLGLSILDQVDMLPVEALEEEPLYYY